MDKYVTLLGAEEVSRAARNIQSAATDMSRAAGSMENSLFRHRQWADDWLLRLEHVMTIAQGEAND